MGHKIYFLAIVKIAYNISMFNLSKYYTYIKASFTCCTQSVTPPKEESTNISQDCYLDDLEIKYHRRHTSKTPPQLLIASEHPAFKKALKAEEDIPERPATPAPWRLNNV